jgi:hypothetical protein
MMAILKPNKRNQGDSQMAGSIKKFLIGASIIASASAITTTPAQALTLTPSSIEFNTENYQTYTGGSDGVFEPNDLSAAVTALTDNDPTSNVELRYTSENSSANVGFSGQFHSKTLGTHTVSVSSVTRADWAIFGEQWLDDFLAGNPEINTILSPADKDTFKILLKKFGLSRSGDPNIGGLTLDEAKGAINLDLVGHLDLKPLFKANQYKMGNPLLDPFFVQEAKNINGPIRASEVAKLTVDGKTYYAYSFNPMPSGILASDDQESYTGIYRYDPLITLTPNTPPTTPPTQSVPEPTAIGGLLLLGGLMATRRRLAS